MDSEVPIPDDLRDGYDATLESENAQLRTRIPRENLPEDVGDWTHDELLVAYLNIAGQLQEREQELAKAQAENVALREQAQWISVKDTLPETGEAVLACFWGQFGRVTFTVYMTQQGTVEAVGCGICGPYTLATATKSSGASPMTLSELIAIPQLRLH